MISTRPTARFRQASFIEEISSLLVGLLTLLNIGFVLTNLSVPISRSPNHQNGELRTYNLTLSCIFSICFVSYYFIYIDYIVLSCQSYQDEPNVGFDVGSFPKDFGYGAFDQDGDSQSNSMQSEQKPRILLMGLRR